MDASARGWGASLPWRWGRPGVPQGHDRGLALPAQRAERGRGEREARTALGAQLHPPRREHPQHVAVSEEDRVAAEVAELGDDPVRAAADVARGLAAGAAVAPQRPARPALAYLRGGQPLV